MSRAVLVSGAAYVTAVGAGAIEPTDLSSLDFASQIPNRSDVRAQGLSQLVASFTAGRALDSAGLKGEPALLEETDLFVATTTGERDERFDEALLETLAADESEATLNRELSNLRPSLFLAQLQNLFAANISIGFGVLGTSITFLGGADAGVRAVAEAQRRIEAGRSDLALVGGAFIGARASMVELYAGGIGANHSGKILVDGEGPPSLGSGAAFIVLESAEHAQSRGRGGGPRLHPIQSFPASRLDEALADAAAADSVWLDTLGCALGPAAARWVEAFAGEARLDNPSLATGPLMEAAFPFLLARALDGGTERRLALAAFQPDGRVSLTRIERR